MKRHILVDTVGLLLHAEVHPADIQDRDGGVLLLSTLFGMYPFLAKLFADAGYQGPQFATAVAEVLPHLSVEIVKRSDHASGFVVLPMRWVVERTLAWLNRCRRLAKDFENLSRNAWHSSSLRQSDNLGLAGKKVNRVRHGSRSFVMGGVWPHHSRLR